MLKQAIALMTLVTLIASNTAEARTYTYKGKGNETWEKIKLKAGDSVVIRDGIYTDLKLNIRGKGTANKPITLRAETPGKVTLTGASWIRYWGDHIIVEGFNFSDTSYSMFKGKVRPIIANRRSGSSSTKSDDMCNHCILQHIKIDNEHPEAIQHSYKWVEVYGYDNTIRYNYFGAKKSESRVLQLKIKHAKVEGRQLRHHIHNNYFASRNDGHTVGNGGEALLIGESSMQTVATYSMVENNLFYDAAVTGEPEVISNKSSYTTFQYNTIRETSAGLTLRHGNNNTVQYNWFLQNFKPGSAGVRVIGKDNVVFNNYIDASVGGQGETNKPAYRPALGMPAAYSRAQEALHPNGYQLSERTVFDNNTIVRSAQPVMLSTWYDDRGKFDMTRPPKETVFTDNLVWQLGIKPSSAPWVRSQSISVDFTPASTYANEYGPDKAEYSPTFKHVKGNISDWKVSPRVQSGTAIITNASPKGCQAFKTGDLIYQQHEGAGADIALMREPLSWTEHYKSPKLGPSWANMQWHGQGKRYSACF